jgi:DNA-binding protein HU-beta
MTPIPITFFTTLKGNTMNRNELVKAISEAGSVDKKTAEKQFQALLTAIKGALAKGEEVTVTDNFKLSVEQRQARAGRNPKTGEPLEIPAKRVIKFAAYKHFRDAVE